MSRNGEPNRKLPRERSFQQRGSGFSQGSRNRGAATVRRVAIGIGSEDRKAQRADTGASSPGCGETRARSSCTESIAGSNHGDGVMHYRRHHHDDFGGWIASGSALALGFMLFRFVVGLLVLIAMLAWYWTRNFRPMFRVTARSLFVVLGVSILRRPLP
jgi:hypothetical protein